jgi:hypothetical protein
MKTRNDKIQVGVGEYYSHLLRWDAWVNGRTKSGQASSLLCAKLQEREQKINERLEYLAGVRSLSLDQLKAAILAGEVDDAELEKISGD